MRYSPITTIVVALVLFALAGLSWFHIFPVSSYRYRYSVPEDLAFGTLLLGVAAYQYWNRMRK